MSQMASVLLPLWLPLFPGLVLSISIARFFGGRRRHPLPLDLVLDRSVSVETAKARRDEIRVLEVKIEALRSMVERLRHSHGQGLINDDEFDELSRRHEEEMRRLDRELIGKRLVVELFELEEIRERMARAFAEKVSELNETILMVRRKLGLEQAVSAKAIEVPVVPRTGVPGPTTGAAPTTAATEPVRSPAEAERPPRPEPRIQKPKEAPKERERDERGEERSGGGEAAEQGVEDELSRIRADVESLLQELEQMEKNRP